MATPSQLANIRTVEELSKEMAARVELDPSSKIRPGPMMDIGREARKNLKTRQVPFDGRMYVVALTPYCIMSGGPVWSAHLILAPAPHCAPLPYCRRFSFMIYFSLIVGCGAVAQNVLPLLPRLVDVPLENVTVIDLFDNSESIKTSIAKGVKFFTEKVTRDTMAGILSKYLTPGDLLIDLAWEIPTIVRSCIPLRAHY